ncbi:MAG TPA: glucosyl-3-phosphoglycerate synthase [Actinomycetes bacterium]|jgi:glucosyl-3-phosphoglycerate synthase|nr:glucosyl-3-phosphoglycerate synthase [Actinomycetes bacterium]
MEDVNPWEWFGERTFHYNQFEPLSKLRQARERLGATVSVAIPARNEAATVGRIVRVLRKALLERSRLIDEIVVMDGGSNDDTAAIARAEGAIVHTEDEVLPEAGPGAGKGEGLWKSLYVCRGDIICWVDADIRNIHPRFVYGLIGPLLTNPGVCYVKAFYERPIRERNVLQPTGGGRVTELLARPVLNLFWPSLAGFVQPLSGEYAGRREVLEQVPFSSGYGVELGLLVDIANRFGVDRIAQVDLECRIHRNQDTQALSRMSFGILQTALTRLAAEGRISPECYSTTLYQFTKQLREYHMQPHQIATLERPPIATVDGYRRRREAVLAGRH